MERYDVFIINLESAKVVAVIGESMSEDRALKRQLTGMSRINEDHDVTIEEAGRYKLGDEIK